jgi:two-component system NtrC family sensor kinase
VSEPPADSGYRYYMSLGLPAALLGALLILSLAIQVVLSWKAHQQLAPVNLQLNRMVRMQSLNLELQRDLLESLGDKDVLGDAEREQMRVRLENIRTMQGKLPGDTDDALSAARDLLADTAIPSEEVLVLVLSQLREVLAQEILIHKGLIEEITRATASELELGLITLVVFPVGAILLIYALRRRILAPLKHLGFLMTLLGRRDASPAPVAAVDPLLRPLTENYNAMVVRLAELEEEHTRREQDLQTQVQNATRALLEQQRNLANAERLAAVGEMMARIAHELRNPLAGVKLAFRHLSQELSRKMESPEDMARIEMVADEVDRIIAVLNSLLEQSRHRPEPARDLTVARAVAELVALTRYQMPPQIEIEQRIDDTIVCQLPDGLFRQALLNLLLNAQQSLGDEGGRIVIEAQTGDGWLRLSVSDDGPGFQQELLDSGIRAFVSQRVGGTGLGLSMIQRFARSLGGGISLSNLEPRGARVTLDLPCRKNRRV